jgi:hypothetical protein
MSSKQLTDQEAVTYLSQYPEYLSNPSWQMAIPSEGLWFPVEASGALPAGYLLVFKKTDGTILYIYSDLAPSPYPGSDSFNPTSYVIDETVQAVIDNAKKLVPSSTTLFLVGIAALAFVFFMRK